MFEHLSLQVPMLSHPTPKSHPLNPLPDYRYTYHVVLQESRPEEEGPPWGGLVKEFLGPKYLGHGLERRWVLGGHEFLEWESLEQSAAGRGPDCLGLRTRFWVFQVHDISGTISIKSMCYVYTFHRPECSHL